MPNSATEQAERRAAIRRLLRDEPVETQQALVNALTRQGLTVTQSSVSRDLRDLGAIKTGAGYELPSSDGDGELELSRVGNLLREIAPAGAHLLVVKTAIGAAQRVALAFDRSGWPEVVGNIGGDDTVFVATISATGQKRLLSRIERARASR
ncbi:MAG: hypothetical protein R3288_14250 [Woeseiaceae bacterium]|nr:hypothetical protein [Woeseiaceae bacterium]